MVIHEDYCGIPRSLGGCGDRVKNENDIAIVTVVEPFKFNSFVQPACLPHPNYRYQDNSEVEVSGFGTLEFAKDYYPKQLRGVDLLLIPCTLGYPDSMICAGVEQGGKDSCSGDSGGPLVQWDDEAKRGKATLIGIVSWGHGCGQVGFYTKVTHFRNWIESKRFTPV